MDTSAMQINQHRRHFFGAVATTIAAAQFGMIGATNAQVVGAPPKQPAVKRGTNTTFRALKQIDAGDLSIGYAEDGPTDGRAVSHLGELVGVTPEVLKQVRDGKPTGDARRDALVTFVRKLARTSGTISDQDYFAIKAAGYSDAQLVEISLAFATTVWRSRGARLDRHVRRNCHHHSLHAGGLGYCGRRLSSDDVVSDEGRRSARSLLLSVETRSGSTGTSIADVLTLIRHRRASWLAGVARRSCRESRF